MRTCVMCGKDLTSTNSRAKYCSSTCRARKSKGLAPVVDLPPADVGEGPLTRATLKELRSADRLDTSLGQASVALARQIDAGMPNTPAAVKEFRATLAEATKGAGPASILDELRARRDAKLSGGR